MADCESVRKYTMETIANGRAQALITFNAPFCLHSAKLIILGAGNEIGFFAIILPFSLSIPNIQGRSNPE